jgi:acyl carrier protein
MTDDALKKIFSEVFEIPVEKVTPETTIQNVEKWDSLTHLHLVMRIESEAGVKFRSTEVPDLTSFTAVAAAVRKAAGRKPG